MTVISKVGISLDRAALLQAATRKLMKTEVLVGIPDMDADRAPEPGQPNPPSNAVIAYTQEFGSEEHNIPPRPFLVPGVQDVKEKLAARLKKVGSAALDGNQEGVDAGFQAVGLVAQNSVQARITDGPFTPLAPKTLAARRARGRTGEKPLIDTGALRRSVSYVVKSKA